MDFWWATNRAKGLEFHATLLPGTHSVYVFLLCMIVTLFANNTVHVFFGLSNYQRQKSPKFRSGAREGHLTRNF